jgi:hypothetical protein
LDQKLKKFQLIQKLNQQKMLQNLLLNSQSKKRLLMVLTKSTMNLNEEVKIKVLGTIKVIWLLL